MATGGETTGRTDANGRATYHVRSRRPEPFLNLTVAPYRVYEDNGARVYVLPPDTARGRELLTTMRCAIGWLRARYGKLTRAPEFSLMEIPDGWGSQADLDGADLAAARMAAARSLCRRARRSEAVRTTPLAEDGTEQVPDWSYSVGALLFVVLDGVMGTEVLDTAYRVVYQRTKASAVTLDTLEATMGRAAPRASAVFEDWVHSTRWYGKLCGDDREDLDVVVASYR